MSAECEELQTGRDYEGRKKTTILQESELFTTATLRLSHVAFLTLSQSPGEKKRTNITDKHP